MHPRNRYRENKPDFRDLAQHRLSLGPYLIQKKQQADTDPYSCTLDFSNPDALRELACAVLSRDFGLDVVLPADRLVPMVPQRLNYIHWLEDLLQDEREREEEGGVKSKQVFGIDIGTGASCIYPLLGTVLNRWQFLATEIDEVSVQSAKDNVYRNNLQDRIGIVKVDPSTALVGAISESQRYDFVMCNPPFYEDRNERYEGVQRTSHRPPPTTFSTGSEGETVTGGGEMGFVRRILRDSLVLRTRIQWYTSMLGKKVSLKTICQELKQHQVPVVVTTRFVQGKTHRWGVAWSFDKRQAYKAKAHTGSRKESQPLSVKVPCREEEAREEALERILHQLHTSFTQLEMKVSEVELGEGVCERQLVCEAHKNTWSQQRRRRRLRQRLLSTSGGDGVKGQNSGAVKEELNTKTCEAAGDLKLSASVPGSSDKETVHCTQAQRGKESRKSTGQLIEGNVESAGSEKRDVLQQIEALNSPCHLQFSCKACVLPSATPQLMGEGGPSPPKKSKMEERQEPMEARSVLLSFEWIEGDSKDLLHQIVQYLKNLMYTMSCDLFYTFDGEMSKTLIVDVQL